MAINGQEPVTLFEYIKQKTHLAGMNLSDKQINYLENIAQDFGTVGDPKAEQIIQAYIMVLLGLPTDNLALGVIWNGALL